MIRGTARVGNSHVSITNNHHDISKDQRYRGMAIVDENGLMFNLHRVRAALDHLTLEDEKASIEIYAFKWSRYYGWMRHWMPYTFKLGNGGSRVRITAPCGETRVYNIKTLDRALSELGA